jgi:hypothetical protein
VETISKVQYRIQFLDGIATVILDLVADARDAASAIALVVDLDWPPNAVSMRLLDEDGREVHSAIKGDVVRR